MKNILITVILLVALIANAQRIIDTDQIRNSSRTATWTFPSITDTILGSSATQTVYNKTIVGGTVSGTTVSGSTIVGGTVSGSTIIGATVSGTTVSGSTIIVNDDSFTVQDNSDITKKLQFQLSGITTGNTRTFTAPDWSGTFVTAATSQTITDKTLTNPTINGGVASGSTIRSFSAVSGTVEGTQLLDSNTYIIRDAGYSSFRHSGDDTKRVQFNLSGITAGQTRTFAFPDWDGTIVTAATSQTISDKTLINPIIGGAILSGTLTGGVVSNTTMVANTLSQINTLSGTLVGGTASGTTLSAGVVQNSTVSGTTAFTGTLNFQNNIIVGSGNGIDFSATADTVSGTMTSELFDDYEEGTWPINYMNNSASGTSTFSIQVATYTKVGRVVQLYFYTNSSSNTQSGTAGLRAYNIPFVANSTANYRAGCDPLYLDAYSMNSTSRLMTATIGPSANYIQFFEIDLSSNPNTVNNLTLDGSSLIMMKCSYETD